jgi:putative replication protein
MRRMKVPFTKNFHVKEVVIDKNGNKYKDCVVVEEGDRIVTYKSGTIDLSKEWGNEWVETPIELIIVITMWDIKIPLEYFNKIEVFRNKKIADNIKEYLSEYEIGSNHFLNFWYRFKGLLKYKEMDGYYHIPYYTRYAINKTGEVKRIIPNFYGKNYYNSRIKLDGAGYFALTLSIDCYISKKGEVKYDDFVSGRQHRLLALVFIKYKKDPLNLFINHIDARRDNNDLSNIEWCNQLENVRHAMILKRMPYEHIPILVKDYFTGTIKSYYNANTASRYLKICNVGISKRIREGDLSPLRGRYSFKAKNDSREWLDVKEVTKPCRNKRQYYIVKNIFTGEERTVYNLANVKKIVGVTVTNLARYIRNGSGVENRPINGYLFRIAGIKSNFRELTREEIIFYRKHSERNMVKTRQGFIVLKDGEFCDVDINWRDIRVTTGISFCRFERIEKDGLYYKERYWNGHRWTVFRLYENDGAFTFSKEYTRYLNGYSIGSL